VQIGITLVGIFTASTAARRIPMNCRVDLRSIRRWLHARELAFGAIVVVMTYVAGSG
jgi:hypothetical protein